MKHIHILALFLLATPACDSPAPQTTERSGTSSGGCEAPEPAVPPSSSACACNLLKPDSCPLGTDCVPWPADSDEEGRCFAPCFGENELGGGYVTTCETSGRELDCYYPGEKSPNGGASYCPACVTCSPVNPLSLVCS